MTQIKYAISIYQFIGHSQSERRLLYQLDEVDSLPSFKVGDRFGLNPFDKMYDHGDVGIVVDMIYDFLSGGDQPKIVLYLYIREETSDEKAERMKRHGK